MAAPNELNAAICSIPLEIY